MPFKIEPRCSLKGDVGCGAWLLDLWSNAPMARVSSEPEDMINAMRRDVSFNAHLESTALASVELCCARRRRGLRKRTSLPPIMWIVLAASRLVNVPSRLRKLSRSMGVC